VVVANLDYGHSSPMGVLPLGVRARVDPIERTIRTLAPAVTRNAADDLGLVVVPEQ
jgi:muramoyltetrapeptide carboxypeptidase LdcA involved in peptidoglycan recycling